jgi:hypothetical protein
MKEGAITIKYGVWPFTRTLNNVLKLLSCIFGLFVLLMVLSEDMSLNYFIIIILCRAGTARVWLRKVGDFFTTVLSESIPTIWYC